MGHFLAGGNRIGRAYNMMCKNHYRSKIIPGFLAVDLEKLIDRNEKLSGPVNRMSFLSRFRCRKLREINLRWRQSNHEGRIGWFRFTKEIDLCIISLMVIIIMFPLECSQDPDDPEEACTTQRSGQRIDLWGTPKSRGAEKDTWLLI